ncbi:hypothetical protein [Kitasatospora sp. NPDC057198]|uniref:hypothetical protein n=1 Tax=Kitasatospora sp. NPDC057198 TaxID=3346046 RepID=UPI003629EF41
MFVPGHRDGDSPPGVRPPDAVTAAPDADAALATVRPQDGRQVREALGGNLFGTDRPITRGTTDTSCSGCSGARVRKPYGRASGGS